MLAVNVRGCAMARQRDRELTLGDGDAVFATRDVTGFILTRPAPGRFIGIRVPREAVALLLGRLDETPLSLVPPDGLDGGQYLWRTRLIKTIP